MEDVADNLVSSQLARGEKEAQVVRSLCSTLSNTGSSPEIVATTMMSSLKRALQEEEPVLMKDIGRTMHEQGTESKILLKGRPSSTWMDFWVFLTTSTPFVHTFTK